jgi:hypothetical protein
MRVKLSKLLSAVLAICIVFVGFTAFADAPVVTVSTTYDYTQHSSAQDGNIVDKAGTITVYADVTGVDNDTEVTFLVNGTSKIVYIDQQTAAANGASFKFTADWLDVKSADVSLGSDGGYTLPKAFKVNPTVNHWNNTTGSVTAVTKTATTEYDNGEVFANGRASYAFTSKVSGDVTNYGITVDGTDFRAMGCADDGTFIVVVQNITEAEANTAVAYCRK